MSITDDIRLALEQEWAEFLNPVGAGGKKSITQKWRDDNPNEWAALRNYRDNGASRPPLQTTFGRQMVEHVDAYILAGGGQEPPPPPPPPTGEAGAAFNARFPWVAPLLAKPSDGRPRSISATSQKHYDYGFQEIVGGSADGVKISSSGTTSDVLLTRVAARDLDAAAKVQGFAWHGPGQRVGVLGARFINVGAANKLAHSAYVGRGGSHDWFLASILSVGPGGHGLMAYPGGTHDFAFANVTSVTSVAGPGLAFRAHPTEGDGPVSNGLIVNALVCVNNRYAVEVLDASGIKLVNCCFFGNKAGSVSGNVQQVDCFTADPDFDSNWKPRHPKVVDGGLAEWLPPFDAYGNPYTRATIGAVAA